MDHGMGQSSRRRRACQLRVGMGPFEGHKKSQGWPHRINVYFLVVLVSNKHVYKIFLKSSHYFQKYEQKCEFRFRVQYPVLPFLKCEQELAAQRNSLMYKLTN